MASDIRQGVFFGVVTGCSGVTVSVFGLSSGGYIAPTVIGGAIGYMINEAGKSSYSTKEAVVGGALAGFAGRFVAGQVAKWIAKPAADQSLTNAADTFRGVVLGSAIGGALIGLAIPTINQKLLTA